ncbi:MAG: phosphoheptose isomerase [Flavobacteriaceae bacterium]|nr:phosphoheptose isomerase [Flavobacteriaceae bacterium]|tara:strand:+ start:5856 stop:6449 length:594 start_codon:yes stop_codon:yes gene_type:complete
MIKKFDFEQINKKNIEDYLTETMKISEYQSELSEKILEISKICVNVLNDGGKIYFCGNGGSASDSQHLAAELVGRFETNRLPIPGVALTTDTSVITSIGNDFGFEYIFSKQVEALCSEKDFLFALSTSGKSKNIIEALKAAKKLNMKTFSLVGENDENIVQYSDNIIKIPSSRTGIVQQAHITIGQIICMNIEASII